MRLVALALAALLPAFASATPTTDLWREALATPGTREILSQNENGYRLDVVTAKTTQVAGATVVRLSFAWAEIDTEREEPAFGKPRALPQRSGLPVQVVVSERGVWVLSKPKKDAAIRTLLKTAPSFPAEGASPQVVTRTLGKAEATCFTMPGPTTKAAPDPVELCLAPGAGLVAARNVVPPLEGVIFAQPAWWPPAE